MGILIATRTCSQQSWLPGCVLIDKGFDSVL
jgi:hypothetical protein